MDYMIFWAWRAFLKVRWGSDVGVSKSRGPNINSHLQKRAWTPSKRGPNFPKQPHNFSWFDELNRNIGIAG